MRLAVLRPDGVVAAYDGCAFDDDDDSVRLLSLHCEMVTELVPAALDLVRHALHSGQAGQRTAKQRAAAQHVDYGVLAQCSAAGAAARASSTSVYADAVAGRKCGKAARLPLKGTKQMDHTIRTSHMSNRGPYMP